MLPVFPAFAGYVPDEFIKVYPNVSYSISPSWSNFVEPYGYVVLLEPVDPMFKKVASMFIQEQIDFYGYTSHFYNGDLFMEMDVILEYLIDVQPKSMEDEYLRSCSKGMMDSIRAIDPEGVWLTQTWVFIDFKLWTKENILLIHCCWVD